MSQSFDETSSWSSIDASSSSFTSKTAPWPSAVIRIERTFSVPSHAPSGKTRRSAPHTKPGACTCWRIVARIVTYPLAFVSSERAGGADVVPVAIASAAATAASASSPLAASSWRAAASK